MQVGEWIEMVEGRFYLLEREETACTFPPTVAEISVRENLGSWCLTILAQTTPPDWIDSFDDEIPEFPAIEAIVQIMKFSFGFFAIL